MLALRTLLYHCAYTVSRQRGILSGDMSSALGRFSVLDLSHALAGPFAASMLAQYGAEVIKIESPAAGDISRRWGPPFYGDESAYFVHLNANKRSLALDLKQPEGREQFPAPCRRRRCRPRKPRESAPSTGSASATRRCVPAIRRSSTARSPGSARTAPIAIARRSIWSAQAESGMISVTGEPGHEGVRSGVSLADITAGLYAAFGDRHGAARTGGARRAVSSSTSRCSKARSASCRM